MGRVLCYVEISPFKLTNSTIGGHNTSSFEARDGLWLMPRVTIRTKRTGKVFENGVEKKRRFSSLLFSNCPLLSGPKPLHHSNEI